MLHAAGQRCHRGLGVPDSPQVWKVCGWREIPANRRLFGGAWCPFERIEAAPGRCYARPPRALPERSLRRVEHTTEPTAERLWDDVSGRLREALNETTYATWFGDASAGELDRRHVLARRSERLHARVDRGALPRIREGCGARRARPRHPRHAHRARAGGVARRAPQASRQLPARRSSARPRRRARSTRSTSS